MNRAPRLAGLLAALALIAALLTGGALGFALGRRPLPPRLHQVSLLGVSRQSLLDSLRLEDGQRARIDTFLDAAEHEAERSITRMMGEVRGITATARESVQAVLDPSQRIRFDSLLLHAVPPRPRSPLPSRDSVR